MKKLSAKEIILYTSLLATCALTGCVSSPYGMSAGGSTLTETISFNNTQGTSGSSCIGTYYGYARLTNSTTGAYWLVPPTNSTSATFTNLTDLGDGANCDMVVMSKRTFTAWCGTNSVTFPVSSVDQYELTMYIKNTPPPPTNNQPLSMQVNWQ